MQLLAMAFGGGGGGGGGGCPYQGCPLNGCGSLTACEFSFK